MNNRELYCMTAMHFDWMTQSTVWSTTLICSGPQESNNWDENENTADNDRVGKYQ